MPRALTAVLLLAVAAFAQSPPLALDGRPLAAPHATLDPAGTLELRGQVDGGERTWRLSFPFLRLPAVGRHDVGGDTGLKASAGDRALRGAVVLEACAPEAVRGQLRYGEGAATHELAFDLRPALAPIGGGAAEPSTPGKSVGAAVDTPAVDDLVFCAVGNTGTGLPGARRVANAIAATAASGPLDFVLLLGNTFMPAGVESTRDPQWQSKFELLFDPERLMVPFYPVVGSCDRPSLKPMVEYGLMSPRWTMPAFTHKFEVRSHGAVFRFIAVDTEALAGKMGFPRNRVTMRMAVGAAAQPADWKIVFGYHAIRGDSPDPTEHDLMVRLRRQTTWLQKYGVDVYLCAGRRTLEMFEPGDGVLHVVSGGGGGPEMAQPIAKVDGSLFGYSGGGFAWFRYDGKQLEISMCDADGKVRYVHHVRKS